MKKWVVALLILISLSSLIVTAQITGYQTAGQTKEIDVPAGWNLVSFPSSTVTGLALGNWKYNKIYQPAMAIYQLKDSKWERFNPMRTLEPNTGYFIDFVQGGKMRISIDVTSQSSIHLTKGVNVIGVSIDVQIKDGKIKSKGTEKSFSDAIDSFWEFDGKTQKWNKIDNYEFTLKPGKGYLLYAKEEGELVFETAKIIGGWSDNFEDGDYTKNPVWKVGVFEYPKVARPVGYPRELDDPLFELDGKVTPIPIEVINGELFVSYPYQYPRSVRLGRIAIESTQAYGTWEFDVGRHVNGKGKELGLVADIWFITSKMTSKKLLPREGYHLYLYSSGSSVGLNKTIGKGEEITILSKKNIPAQDNYHIKITRDKDGRFKVQVAGQILEGTDNTITTSTHFLLGTVEHRIPQYNSFYPELTETTGTSGSGLPTRFKVDNIRVTPLSS